MLLILLGCAGGWLERPYACESDVLDWWDSDPAWLVAGATEDADGVWQFDAASGYAAIDHLEGYWDPGTGRFGLTEWFVAESPRTRVDVNATGRIQKDGDLDLEAELHAYDVLGAATAWTESIHRAGCAMESTANADGIADPQESTYSLAEDDVVAGTYSFAPAGSDIAWAETSALSSDLVRTSHAGWSDGSYVEDRVSRPSGETAVVWEDHSADADGWVTSGDEAFDLDGTRHATTREVYLGELARECEITESYAGDGTATCFEPGEGRTCTLTWSSDACERICDDGTETSC
jgi:hypothetical protein